MRVYMHVCTLEQHTPNVVRFYVACALFLFCFLSSSFIYSFIVYVFLHFTFVSNSIKDVPFAVINDVWACTCTYKYEIITRDITIEFMCIYTNSNNNDNNNIDLNVNEVST